MADIQPSGFKRVWFITGASRGIGALIAEAALADGNAVVATGRNVTAIVERLGDSAALLPVALDVTDAAQAKAAARAAEAAHEQRVMVLRWVAFVAGVAVLASTIGSIVGSLKVPVNGATVLGPDNVAIGLQNPGAP